MARVPFTLRIDERERAALEDLSRIEGRPVNQLLNEAVKSFLMRRRPTERTLEENLARLRAYRKRDPHFRRAIDAFVESEASLDDPVEGEQVEGELEEGVPKQVPHLTLRERQVLDLIREARSNREIAGQLGIDERTVKAHVGRLIRKTGAESRVELSLRAGGPAQSRIRELLGA